MKILRVVNNINKGISFRSVNELKKAIKKSQKEIIELADVFEFYIDDLVKVTSGESIVLVDTSDDSKKRLRRGRVRKSVNKPNISFSPVDVKNIEKNFQYLEALEGSILKSDMYLASLETSFRTHPDYVKIKKGVLKLKEDAINVMEDAEEAIRSIANGYVNEDFLNFIKAVKRHVLKHVKGNYKKSETKLFVRFYDDVIEFKAYLILHDLYGIDKQTEYKQYSIILSNVISGEDNIRSYYVNTNKQFVIPSKRPSSLDIGTEVKTELDAFYKILNLIAIDGIKEYSEFPSDFNITRKQYKDFAGDIEFENDGSSIKFKLLEGLTPTQRMSAAKELKKLLIESILDDSYHDLHDIVFEIEKSRKYYWAAFYPELKDRFKFGYLALNWLEDEYDLSSTQIREIKKIIAQGK